MAGEAAVHVKLYRRVLDLSLCSVNGSHSTWHIVPHHLPHHEMCLLGSREHQCPEPGTEPWAHLLPTAGEGVTSADSWNTRRKELSLSLKATVQSRGG